MCVRIARPEDIPAWLALAAEVGPMFGPLVNDPGFVRALEKNIGRQTAFCVREADGPPGAPLIGRVRQPVAARAAIALTGD